jgi:hypothetical protein
MIRTNILEAVLRKHTLREGHADMACGDVGCAAVIARDYRVLDRRRPPVVRVTTRVVTNAIAGPQTGRGVR